MIMVYTPIPPEIKKAIKALVALVPVKTDFTVPGNINVLYAKISSSIERLSLIEDIVEELMEALGEDAFINALESRGCKVVFEDDEE